MHNFFKKYILLNIIASSIALTTCTFFAMNPQKRHETVAKEYLMNIKLGNKQYTIRSTEEEVHAQELRINNESNMKTAAYIFLSGLGGLALGMLIGDYYNHPMEKVLTAFTGTVVLTSCGIVTSDKVRNHYFDTKMESYLKAEEKKYHDSQQK